MHRFENCDQDDILRKASEGIRTGMTSDGSSVHAWTDTSKSADACAIMGAILVDWNYGW